MKQTIAAAISAIAILLAPVVHADDVIKVGTVTPSTGGMAPIGIDLAQSYEIAVDQINAKGGLLGKKVVLIRGDATNAQEGITAVDNLVGREKVDFLIGTIATAISNAASETALNHGKLYWETNANSIALTERKLPNFVRTSPSTNDYAKMSLAGGLDIVAKTLGKKPQEMKVWIEHEDSSYGTNLAKEQERLFKLNGFQVNVSSHSARSVDFSDAILRAKSFAPDIWLHSGYLSDTNMMLRTARDQNFKPGTFMLVGLGDTTDTLDSLGKEYLEGILVVVFPKFGINPKFGPGAKEFYDAYVKKWGSPPLASSGMTGFVGMKVAFEAIQAAGSSEYEKVVKAAAAMKKPLGTYETGYGVDFDETMQNKLAMPIITQWQSGKNVPVYPSAAVADGVSLIDFRRK